MTSFASASISFHNRILSRGSTAGEEIKLSGPFHGRTLFLVDDDVDLLRAYLEILREEGVDAKGISEADKAIEILHQGPLPSILLVDCRMPQMDGTKFLRLLKEKIPGIADQTHIYGFSALGERSAMAKELSPHVRGFIEKPSDIFEFVSLIHGLFEKTQTGGRSPAR